MDAMVAPILHSQRKEVLLFVFPCVMGIRTFDHCNPEIYEGGVIKPWAQSHAEEPGPAGRRQAGVLRASSRPGNDG